MLMGREMWRRAWRRAWQARVPSRVSLRSLILCVHEGQERQPPSGCSGCRRKKERNLHFCLQLWGGGCGTNFEAAVGLFCQKKKKKKIEISVCLKMHNYFFCSKFQFSVIFQFFRVSLLKELVGFRPNLQSPRRLSCSPSASFFDFRLLRQHLMRSTKSWCHSQKSATLSYSIFLAFYKLFREKKVDKLVLSGD